MTRPRLIYCILRLYGNSRTRAAVKAVANVWLNRPVCVSPWKWFP